MPYHLRHAPIWDDGSEQLPPRVLEMKWPLVAWLEAVLSKDVEVTPTGASVSYDRNKWSKYKLLPYAPVCRFDPPIVGEGILVGIDQAAAEAALPPSPAAQYPNLVWIPPFEVFPADHRRSYHWISIPAHVGWGPGRIGLLARVRDIIRAIEGNGR